MAPDVKSEARSAVGNELVAAFNAIDKDGNGKLSMDELADAMRAVKPDMSEKEVADMLKVAEADSDPKDGEVSLEEFVMMMLFKQPVAA